MTDVYRDFLESKTQWADGSGFDPAWMPDFLFPFQRALVEWAVRKGRAAIFADCGLGKTPTGRRPPQRGSWAPRRAPSARTCWAEKA